MATKSTLLTYVAALFQHTLSYCAIAALIIAVINTLFVYQEKNVGIPVEYVHDNANLDVYIKFIIDYVYRMMLDMICLNVGTCVRTGYGSYIGAGVGIAYGSYTGVGVGIVYGS